MKAFRMGLMRIRGEMFRIYSISSTGQSAQGQNLSSGEDEFLSIDEIDDPVGSQK